MSDSSDPIWDEHKWESHLNQLEVKSKKLKRFINNSWGENDPVWLRFLKEYEDVEDALESYIDDELSYEEAYFPDDIDELEEDDDVDEDIFLKFEELTKKEDLNDYKLDPGEEIEFLNSFDYTDEDFDEMDEDGDEWKSEIEFSEQDIYEFQIVSDPFGCYPFYDESRDLSLYFLKRTTIYPDSISSEEYLDFMHELLQVTTKFAAALSFNLDDAHYLGAVITYFKRALNHANKALSQIRLLRHNDLLANYEFNELTTRLFELRNELALIIQKVREQLNNKHL